MKIVQYAGNLVQSYKNPDRHGLLKLASDALLTIALLADKS